MATNILSPDIKLLVIKGNDIGKSYEANRFPIIIGRDECADFVIKNDSNISRKHASIESRGSKLSLKDLNSTNGTFADNIKIEKKTEISDGTVIILGNTWIELITAKRPCIKRASISNECSTGITTLKDREAIFVIDLHNSSKIADTFGDEAVMKINKNLKKITIPEANRYKSKFIKCTGDGYLITFEKPENSLKASIQILKKINNFNSRKTDKEKINVRIGLNFGDLTIEPNGDRLGHEVNVAFRIEGLKYTNIKKTKKSITQKMFPQFNRILISEKFLKEINENNYTINYLGDFNLKGIRSAHKIYQIII